MASIIPKNSKVKPSYRHRIDYGAKSKKSKVVLALDPEPAPVAELEGAAKKTIKMLHSHICAIKINFHLILPLSSAKILQINNLAHSHGLQCIADVKLNDIENTNRIAMEHLAGMGFDAVIANPFIGSSSLTSLVGRAHTIGLGVIALVYMSHPSAGEGYGLGTVGKDGRQTAVYRLFFDRAVQADADGIVVGATQVDILKEIGSDAKRKIPIYSPGIGAQGGSVEQAGNNGADYFIIGRSITGSRDPVKAAREVNEKIRCLNPARLQ